MDDVVVYALEGTKSWVIFVWLAAVAVPLLKFHESVNTGAKHVVVLASALQIMIWGMRAIGRWAR